MSSKPIKPIATSNSTIYYRRRHVSGGSNPNSTDKQSLVTDSAPHQDAATGLPSLTTLFSGLRPLAEQGAQILYIHLPSNQIIEERFGWEVLETYLSVVFKYLTGIAQDLRRDRCECFIVKAFADDYVMMLSPRGNIDQLSHRIADGMAKRLVDVDSELATIHKMYIGKSSVRPRLKIHPERLIYRGIQRAQTEATDVGRQQLSGQIRLLDRCITSTRFAMVYQPLIRVSDRSVFAYEALVRCSQGELKSPHVLFNVAEQGGRIWQLSRVLRRMAVQPASDLPGQSLLFINLHPQDINDPNLLALEPFLTKFASRIVLEVTERAAIGDFKTFRKNVEILRGAGLRFAIDDLGSGYAALNSAAELHPEYIKLDMTLIRDIHKSRIRQNLVRKMIAFAIEAGSEVVGEGVETAEEFRTLVELGCHYVQGYYFALPGPPFAAVQNGNKSDDTEQ